MFAVIRTGGKQYRVAPDDVLEIEKIEGATGDKVNFSDVLMVAGEGEPQFGAPLVAGAVVSAEVVEQKRGPKIIIFKKKRRQNYRRKNGHRQSLTMVKILGIDLNGSHVASAAKTVSSDEGAKSSPAKKARASKASAQSE